MGLVERYPAKGTFVAAVSDRPAQVGQVLILVHGPPERGALTVIQQEYVLGFEQECGERGYSTTLRHVPRSEEKLNGGEAAGVCLLGIRKLSGGAGRCPVVHLAGMPGEGEGDCIHTDGVDGTRQAASHLIELGHRRIGCHTKLLRLPQVRARVEALKRALEAADLDVDARDFPISGSEPSPDMREVLVRSDRVTAVFCPSDPDGLAVLGVAGELGLKVPDDLSIVSYDGTILAEHSIPPLTAVYADRIRAGRRAAVALLERIDGTVTGPAREIITPVRLRVGGTTAGPAG